MLLIADKMAFPIRFRLSITSQYWKVRPRMNRTHLEIIIKNQQNQYLKALQVWNKGHCLVTHEINELTRMGVYVIRIPWWEFKWKLINVISHKRHSIRGNF